MLYIYFCSYLAVWSIFRATKSYISYLNEVLIKNRTKKTTVFCFFSNKKWPHIWFLHEALQLELSYTGLGSNEVQ